jgi:3-phosphoshikimate 1-carboxyvinyltransferase
VIHEPGPSRDHTERMLRAFGASVCTEGASVRLAGGQALRSPNGSAALAAPLPRAAAPDGQRAGQVVVPGDFSSAAFLLVAAAIVPGSEVWLRDVGTNPTRTGLYDVLASMGAEIGMPGTEEQGEAVPANGPADGGAGPLGEPAADLFARSSGLLAGQVAGDLVVRMIDEFPIFAVAATQAEGMTTIRDAAELRVKESDRISSVVQELGKLGARIDELPDGMLIHGPARLQGTRVDSHRDHRLAMALAVAGLVADGETVVEDAGAIDDSFPGFTELMRELGADMATEG